MLTKEGQRSTVKPGVFRTEQILHKINNRLFVSNFTKRKQQSSGNLNLRSEFDFRNVHEFKSKGLHVKFARDPKYS